MVILFVELFFIMFLGVAMFSLGSIHKEEGLETLGYGMFAIGVLGLLVLSAFSIGLKTGVV